MYSYQTTPRARGTAPQSGSGSPSGTNSTVLQSLREVSATSRSEQLARRQATVKADPAAATPAADAADSAAAATPAARSADDVERELREQAETVSVEEVLDVSTLRSSAAFEGLDEAERVRIETEIEQARQFAHQYLSGLENAIFAKANVR